MWGSCWQLESAERLDLVYRWRTACLVICKSLKWAPMDFFSLILALRGERGSGRRAFTIAARLITSLFFLEYATQKPKRKETRPFLCVAGCESSPPSLFSPWSLFFPNKSRTGCFNNKHVSEINDCLCALVRLPEVQGSFLPLKVCQSLSPFCLFMFILLGYFLHFN